MATWKVHAIHLSSQQQRHFWPTEPKAWRNLSQRVVWVSETSGWLQQVLEKCLGSLNAITRCRHILWGAAHPTPSSIMGAQKLLHPFFFSFGRKISRDWVCRLRTDRPEELDETWFQPHHGSRALISSPHGVVIKLKLLRRTSYSLAWFVSHPSLCLSSQSAGSVSLLMNSLFWTRWLHLFGFSETLIRYMQGFHKPQISPSYDSVRSVDKAVPRGIKGSPSLISTFQSNYSYHQVLNLHSKFYTPVQTW